jgi:hypothetical protein
MFLWGRGREFDGRAGDVHQGLWYFLIGTQSELQASALI